MGSRTSAKTKTVKSEYILNGKVRITFKNGSYFVDYGIIKDSFLVTNRHDFYMSLISNMSHYYAEKITNHFFK